MALQSCRKFALWKIQLTTNLQTWIKLHCVPDVYGKCTFLQCIGYVDIAGRSTAMGRKTSAGWECLKITRQVALRLLHSSLASFFVFR